MPGDRTLISSQPPFSPIKAAFRNHGRAGRLALKELRETLRDRRTLMTLLLMPLLVYPLLGVILQKALLSAIVKPAGEMSYSIIFCSESDARRFQIIYAQGRRFVKTKIPDKSLKLCEPPQKNVFCRGEHLLAEGADLAVLFRQDRESPEQWELFYREGDSHSQALVLQVEQVLQAANRDSIQRVLAQKELSLPGVADVAVKGVPQEPSVAPAFSLATFVPLMLILMTVTGAVYPAIDLTAGERERGTLEVLVAAPVPRMELLFAKFVAVLTVAMLTALVNLFAMLITVYASGLESLVFGVQGLSWPVLGQILALLFLFAGFFSAVMLALTSFARSFKEAQAYLIPLMLAALAPGIFSLTPGLRMNTFLAVMPLVNIVLLGRDLLQGHMVGKLFIWAVTSTILYGLLALALAAKVFGSDAILYGSQGSVRDLFRRPKTIRLLPTLTQAMFALAVLFPAFVVLGSLPNRYPNLPISSRLGISAALTLLLFAGWPAVMVWQNRVRFRSAFRMKKPSLGFLLTAVLWGTSLWVWAYELELFTMSPDRLKSLHAMFEAIQRDFNRVPLAWRLLTLAVVPAACEEWFFRGYLLSGLRARMSDLQAVLVSAGLFGLFHVVVRDVMFFERFLPSSLMGLMLGWLAVRSGSVWPGMLLHVLHNGLLLMIGAYQKELMDLGIGLSDEQHLPWVWLAGSACAILLGAGLLIKISPKNPNQTGPLAESLNP